MSEDQIIHPKVFISYSWAVQDSVKVLADRLIINGVDVIIDIYNLKEGQDKYKFMEQAVNNPEIGNVLIICDKTYTEKADNRTGGVGDETVIITPELYGNNEQTKFIPVIFEKDETGNPYCPAYLKSRLYIDFSDINLYEEKYAGLLRLIYKKPFNRRPELGEMPLWLNNENVDLSAIKTIVRKINSHPDNGPGRLKYLLKEATDIFVETIKQYRFQDEDIAMALPALIEQSKQTRDLFLDICKAIIDKGTNIEEPLVSFFETLYNQLHDATNDTTLNAALLEFRDFVIWEYFINLTALLLYYERYKELYELLIRPYYIRMSPQTNQCHYTFYTSFWHTFSIIENQCKPKSDNPNLFTLSGQILVSRISEPELTIESIANADIILYQLSTLIFRHDDEIAKCHIGYWFPRSYVYHREKQSFWNKMQSRRYCAKIAPLFGVTTLAEMFALIEYSSIDTQIRYPGDLDHAPGILSNINPKKIGTLP